MTTSEPRRPRVICHMLGSIDGRILTDGWPLSEEGRRQYERVHESYAPDAWICGRVTMEEGAQDRASGGPDGLLQCASERISAHPILP